ncbi:MAG TPA: glycosyltransferase, partial [Thermoanaerobaculia bacterium]
MISLLVVNFRSSALAHRAIVTARAATSSPLQVVIVDNSCDPHEAGALENLADVLIVSETNLGYAGGINLGRRSCLGEIIVLCNPDIEFRSGAIDRLVEALGEATVAGPAFFWDAADRWHLPPGDVMTAWEKIDSILASRSFALQEQLDRRRIRRRTAFWSLKKTTRVRTLSGAVLAIRGADFDRLDGFDERFRLYFEETDFLRTAAERHERVVFVPAAHCRHIYNQSAAQIAEEAAARYAESELRYLEKWNGPFLARAMKRLERPLRVAELQPLPRPLEVDRDDLLIEASPLPTFATAAGCFAERGVVELPAEILESVGGRPLYLRMVDLRTWEVLG